MKKLGFILAVVTVAFASCIKVDIDNSSVNNGNTDQDFDTKQEEIIATKIITGIINDGEAVDLPKGK